MVVYLVAGAFGLVAMALCIAAVGQALEVRRLLREGLRARATVRELRAHAPAMRSTDERGSEDPVYAPVLEFATADGKMHEVEGDASNPPRYKVGDEVSVLFHAADPSGARIETFAGLWLGVVLTGLGGAITLCVAAFILGLAGEGR
jgi:hypothetical protein